jgi:DNA mismatch repair ATPase MutL
MGSHNHGHEIKKLEDSSVRRIVAEQAVTDLSSVVKELVDNALDAQSTSINSKCILYHIL